MLWSSWCPVPPLSSVTHIEPLVEPALRLQWSVRGAELYLHQAYQRGRDLSSVVRVQPGVQPPGKGGLSDETRHKRAGALICLTSSLTSSVVPLSVFGVGAESITCSRLKSWMALWPQESYYGQGVHQGHKNDLLVILHQAFIITFKTWGIRNSKMFSLS